MEPIQQNKHDLRVAKVGILTPNWDSLKTSQKNDKSSNQSSKVVFKSSTGSFKAYQQLHQVQNKQFIQRLSKTIIKLQSYSRKKADAKKIRLNIDLNQFNQRKINALYQTAQVIENVNEVSSEVTKFAQEQVQFKIQSQHFGSRQMLLSRIEQLIQKAENLCKREPKRPRQSQEEYNQTQLVEVKKFIDSNLLYSTEQRDKIFPKLKILEQAEKRRFPLYYGLRKIINQSKKQLWGSKILRKARLSYFQLSKKYIIFLKDLKLNQKQNSIIQNNEKMLKSIFNQQVKELEQKDQIKQNSNSSYQSQAQNTNNYQIGCVNYIKFNLDDPVQRQHFNRIMARSHYVSTESNKQNQEMQKRLTEKVKVLSQQKVNFFNLMVYNQQKAKLNEIQLSKYLNSYIQKIQSIESQIKQLEQLTSCKLINKIQDKYLITPAKLVNIILKRKQNHQNQYQTKKQKKNKNHQIGNSNPIRKKQDLDSQQKAYHQIAQVIEFADQIDYQLRLFNQEQIQFRIQSQHFGSRQMLLSRIEQLIQKAENLCKREPKKPKQSQEKYNQTQLIKVKKFAAYYLENSNCSEQQNSSHTKKSRKNKKQSAHSCFHTYLKMKSFYLKHKNDFQELRKYRIIVLQNFQRLILKQGHQIFQQNNQKILKLRDFDILNQDFTIFSLQCFYQRVLNRAENLKQNHRIDISKLLKHARQRTQAIVQRIRQYVKAYDEKQRIINQIFQTSQSDFFSKNIIF